MNRTLPLLLSMLTACATVGTNPSAPREPFTVKITGHGPPMLFIPGLSSPGAVWDEVVAHEQERFECHVLSLAGFAGQRPIDGPLMPAVQQALVRYLTEHRLEKPVIVGHSLGGFLGLWLAENHPSLVGRLIIVDAAPSLAALSAPDITELEAKLQGDQLRQQVRTATPDERPRFARAMSKAMASDAARQDLVAGWSMKSDIDAVADAAYFVMTNDLRPALPKVTAPTLVIGTWVGYRPYLGRADLLRRFTEQYAACTTCTVTLNDRAKHFVMLDDPRGLTTQLDAFLQSAAPTPIVTTP